MNPLVRYARWLHTGFPAGGIEPRPEVGAEGATNLPGVRIAGDLLGTPLLKLAVDSGARAARAVARELEGAAVREGLVDVAIVGAGPAGVSAALEAKAHGLRCALIDARAAFATIHDFPTGKPIFLYPTGFAPESRLRLEGDNRERLLDSLARELEAASLEVRHARLHALERRDGEIVLRDSDGTEIARARRVILALGRSGDPRRLGIPGETLPHVRHRFHDPAAHRARCVVVVGGGDAAVEAAIAIARAGGEPTLVHRGQALTRPKRENLDTLLGLAGAGRVELRLGAHLRSIEPGAVAIAHGAEVETRTADDVLILVGTESAVPLLQRLGVRIEGVRTASTWVATLLALALTAFVYAWKSGGALTTAFRERGLFPFGLGEAIVGDANGAFARVLALTLDEPGFHYAFAYSLAVLGFGIRRIARTPTPYVRRQTLVLGLVQWIPLFIVPYLLLPWLGRIGAFDHGAGRAFADAFFPVVDYGHGREYWRAFGFVLAFPLFVWNVLTSKPSAAWLALSFVQTFVIIPWIVRRYGKGAYCGFLCSCGALAETLGDAHRSKMPHGPVWNRLNLLGQGVLAAAFGLLGLRLVAWLSPSARLFGRPVRRLSYELLQDAHLFAVNVDYAHVVDFTMAGVLGLGLYVGFSGRTWCRFACPLAALMNVYARAFTRFRIFTDASRCIACNACTTVCHQGIDVMHFATRGEPMDDPQCVRCSACVAACPTAALTLGHLAADGTPRPDALESSLVRLREDGKRGLRVV